MARPIRHHDLLYVCDVGAESVRLSVDGRERSYLIERPPGDATRPTIIMLHGFGGTGADIGRRTGLDRLGPQSGFVAVFPDGLRNRWNHFLPGKETAGFSQERLRGAVVFSCVVRAIFREVSQ